MNTKRRTITFDLVVVYLLAISLIISGCRSEQSAEPAPAPPSSSDALQETPAPSPPTEPPPLTLGYIEGESGRSGSPAAFVGLGTAVVIEISDTQFNNMRRMESYKEKITYPSGETAELEFRDIVYNERQQVVGYTAEINGQVVNGPTLKEFEDNKSVKGWAFSPGGYSLPCPDSRSRLGYTRIGGKFQVARQVIICPGAEETYVIQASEYARDIHGDLTGLLVEISPALPTTEIAVLAKSPAAISIPGCQEVQGAISGNTFLCINSTSGEQIGGGESRLLTPQDGKFTLEPWGDNRFNAELELGDGNWYLEFAAPRGQAWRSGVYENAKGMPGHSGDPTLNISGNSVGCDVGESFGKFEILELAYDNASQEIKRLAINFEYHCDGAPAALWGALRFNSNVPVDTSTPSMPAISGPKPGHWEGSNPTVSFDLTADMKVINFKMVTPFVGSSCGYTVPEIIVEPDNTFSIDATTDTFVGGIQGKFDSDTTASGTQGIIICGNVAGLDMNIPAWRATWQSPELTGSGNETVEQAATSTPALPADVLTPVLPLATSVPEILEPPVSPTPLVYVIQTGDTLFSIAFAFGVDVATLREINNLTDDDLRTLAVGQTLIIKK